MIRTELEHYLTNELKTLLGMEADFAVDPNEDFSQYGMNSIVSARYTHLLSEAFDVKLSPKQIVDYSSIGKLAAHLEETYPEKLSDFTADTDQKDHIQAAPETTLIQEQIQEPTQEQTPEPTQEPTPVASQPEEIKARWVQKIVSELKLRAQKVDAIISAATNKAQAFKEKATRAGQKTAKEGQNLLDFSFIFFSTNNNKKDTVSEAGENKYRYVNNIAKYADANGFKALWMPERHFFEFGGIFPQPAVLLSHIAAQTQQIRLRSGSVILPLHHPASVVESWSVLDNLSNGRVDMGFASGWNPNDFVISPDTYHNLRDVWFSRMDEVQKLWRGEAVTYQNGKDEGFPVRVFPRPQQPQLNMWVTISGNPKSFAEAGKRGHNVLTMLTSKPIDELAHNIQVYRDAREQAGFDPDSGVITLMLHSYVHEDEAKVDAAVNEHYFQYIKSGLLGHLQAQDTQPSEDEINRMVEHSFHFQRKNSALFGTPEQCNLLLGKMRAAGVNEIACLVDFGISDEQMYDTLPYLTEVKNNWAQGEVATPVSMASVLASPSLCESGSSPAANTNTVSPAVSPAALQEFAIIGIAGRYPKADNIDEFWQNLTNNHNCISEIHDRYNWQAIYGDPKTEVGKTNIKHFGLMDNIFHFDAAFFSISKREGEVMDPHARLLLEAAWQCVENAGYAPQSLNQSKTGVFLAFYNSEFGNLLAQMEIEKSSEPYISTSLSGTIKANRISYILGLQGPSEVYDTACSSGLVATHRAMQSINAGDCDQALVGGVSLLLTPDRVVSLSKMGILNETGVCNPFSFPANKEVIGEGVGCIMIKPLAKAEAAGDPIYAVISGSDVNHHGDTSGRLTMPSAKSIAALMSKTYQEVGVSKDQLIYIEGHGSGNDSDAVELMAFRQATQSLTSAKDAQTDSPDTENQNNQTPIYVGSVKSNIGFGEASGGIAQLTKLALALNYRVLPATLNFEAVDPSVNLSDTPLTIQTQNVPLADISANQKQYASAIAYGLGGTNAHILLRRYQGKIHTAAVQASDNSTLVPFILSAKNTDELRRYGQILFSHLSNNAAQKHYESQASSAYDALMNIARTLIARDRCGAERVAFLATSWGRLLSLLKIWLDGDEATLSANPHIVLPDAANDIDKTAEKTVENASANHTKTAERLAQEWVLKGKSRQGKHRQSASGAFSSNDSSNSVDWTCLFNWHSTTFQKLPLPGAPFSGSELKLPLLEDAQHPENAAISTAAPVQAAPLQTASSQANASAKQSGLNSPALVSQSTESWLADRLKMKHVSNGITRVEITLHSSDYFIAQHVVDGTPVLPGAAYLALLGEVSNCLYAASLVSGSRTTIKNLAFVMPFEMPASVQQSVLAIDVETSGAFRCYQLPHDQLQSDQLQNAQLQNAQLQSDQPGTLCCKGSFDIPGTEAEQPVLAHFTPQLKKQTPSVAPVLMDAQGFWGITNSAESKQCHGPQMRRVHRLQMQDEAGFVASNAPSTHLSANGASTKCVASLTALLLTHCHANHEVNETQLVVEQFGSYIPLPAAPFLDSALAATVGFAIARNHPQSASVPFSIETAHLLDVIPADKVLYAIVTEKPGKLPRFNISLEDGQGKVYAVILGYFAKSFEQLPVATAQPVAMVNKPAQTQVSTPQTQVSTPQTQVSTLQSQQAQPQKSSQQPISAAASPENNTTQVVGDTVSEQTLARFLVNQFRQMIATFLKLDIEEVPVDEGLEYLGLDSIAVNELTDQVSSSMVIDVPATLMFEYTCIQDMAEYLAEEYEEELMAAFADELNTHNPAPASVSAPAVSVSDMPISTQAATQATHSYQTASLPPSLNPSLNTQGEVAVVGMGGLYPGAENVHDFWEKLRSGSDLITELPASRRDMVYGLYQEDMTDLPRLFGGFVENSDYFDAGFFGLSEEETLAMDPQQRLFLIASWQAFEDAGYYPMSFAGQNIGVYAGAIICEYLQLITLNHFDSSFIGTGCALSGIANRTSYFFDLNGPSQTLDSACCSSLYAIDRAVIDINAGVCDAAIVGGVSYISTPYGFNAYQAMDYLSDDWRCKAFGANGDGWSKGELFAAVFLKPYEKALQDNDNIYAVIKATGTNHGGKSHFYEQPNSNKHAELIKNVYRKANVDPRNVIHIEAHGTGTEMGDALEFNVLSKSLKELAKEQVKEQQLPLNTNYCGLGSIKSNVGHSEAAAGISGFIKSVLMLHHQTLAPTLHASQPNQHIRLQKSPLFIASETMTAQQRALPEGINLASVHSFNFSGAAAHVVIGSHHREPQPAMAHHGLSRFPVCISAKTPAQLLGYLQRLHHYVSECVPAAEHLQTAQLAQIVTTINRSKSFFDHRMGWVVSSLSELRESLAQAINLTEATKLDAGHHQTSTNTAQTFHFRSAEITIRSAKKVTQYPPFTDANAEALIELWLQEPNFDWSQVLGESFTKLPLPTYPFDMSRAYLPPDLSPDPQTNNKRTHNKSAHNKSSPAQTTPVQAATATNSFASNAPVAKSVIEPSAAKSVSATLDTGKVSQFVQQTLASLFEMPVKDVDLSLPMNAMPFDSLGIVSLSEALNREYRLSTTPPDFFAFVHLNEIVELVLEQADTQIEAPAAPTLVPSPVPTLVATSAEETPLPVSQLSASSSASVAVKAVNNNSESNEGVAIIGVSAALPGANNMNDFWQVLSSGKDCIGEVPDDRWDWQAMWGDPTVEVNKCNVKWAGFVDDVHGLDASFFEISPREAMLMDPQQRLLLTHAWQVLEDAGYAPSSLANSNTAVVVGIGHNGYEQVLIDAGFDIDGHSATGLSASIGSNRISYFLNLHGPSESIDTACSSSLVAIHRAVRLLRSGETPLAIAGGVNALVNKDVHASLNRAGMLSLDGRCKTFSDNANGYARGEGVGLVLLKPMAQAQVDGDHIYAVIRGSAENHGGRANSLTAPNPKAQAALLQAAYRDAGFDPATVGYIEAHGTGTELGDPIEINGLKTAFSALLAGSDTKFDAQSHGKIGIGSVKTNIGHLEVAAGVAGLVKVLLQFKHQTLAKTLHCDRVNPYIRLEKSPFFVVQEQQTWQRALNPQGEALPLRAGVSSFGFGGANAHVVLEEYIAPAVAESAPSELSPSESVAEIILLSAKTEAQLQQQAKNLLDYVDSSLSELNDDNSDNSTRCAHFASLAYTLRVGRDEMNHRLAFTASNPAELVLVLESYLQENGAENPFADSSSGNSSRNSPSAAQSYFTGNIETKDELLSRFAHDDDFSELLEKWLANNKTDKLLSLWVKGLDIPWHTLASSNVAVQRLPLPTYPFSPRSFAPNAVKKKGQNHSPAHSDGSVPGEISARREISPQPVAAQTPAEHVSKESASTENASLDPDAFLSLNSVAEWATQKEAAPEKQPEPVQKAEPVQQAEPAVSAEPVREVLLQPQTAIKSKPRISLGAPVDKLATAADTLPTPVQMAREEASEETLTLAPALTSLADTAAAQSAPVSGLNVEQLAHQLADGLASALYIDTSDIEYDKSFVELGLDSILAVEWVRWINNQFSIDFPVMKLYDHPNIHALAAFVAGLNPQVTTDNVANKSANEAVEMTSSPVSVPVDIPSVSDIPSVTEIASPIELAAQASDISAQVSLTEQSLTEQSIAQQGASVARPAVNQQACCDSLQASLAQALYVDTSDIDIDKPFNELGLDSIIAVEWVRSINAEFSMSMPVTKIYDYPTVGLLAGFVAEAVIAGQGSFEQGSFKQSAQGELSLGKAQAEAVLAQENHSSAQNKTASAANTSATVPLASFKTQSVKTESVEAPMAAGAKVDSKGTTGLVISSVHTLDEIGLRNWQVPAPQAGEIKLAVKASAINFPDTLCVNGLYPTIPAYPFVPGFEVAGVVTDIGEAVTEFAIGDAVIAVTGENLGGHAQCVNVPAASAVRKPGNISFEQACSLPVVFGTVFAAFEMAQLQAGEKVLIHTATGGCGLMALQLANLKNCEIFGTTSKPEKQHILAQLGVPHVLDYKTPAGFDTHIAKLTEGKGVDVVLNMLSGEAIQRGVNCLGAGGRYLELAVHGLKTAGKLDLSGMTNNQQFLSLDFRKKALENADNASAGSSEMNVMAAMVNMVEAGLIVPVVSRVYPYSHIKQALEYVSRGEHIGKVVISHQLNQQNSQQNSQHNNQILDYTQQCIAAIAQQKALTKPDWREFYGNVYDSQSLAKQDSTPAPEHTFNAVTPENKHIAVIGMAGQFPKSPDLSQYWQNIANGTDCISPVPESRWSVARYFDADPQAPGKANCAWMGLLDNADKFDPLFFAISPAEAKYMDPQQRLFLQACWHCIEDAAMNPDDLSGRRVGVFVGCTTGQYGNYDDADELNAQGLMGGNTSILTSRISYFLNLKGPSIAIDTACSASLVAICEAANNLLLGNCDMALAGGVSVICGPNLHVMTTKAGMLSPDGRCFTFDNRANGFVPGEGVGVVLLKPLQKALNDGDPIHSVIAGWGVNQDGKTNGITAPSASSQAALEQQVYRDFGISPDTITLVEAHGTGTKLGDPIEVEALKESYGAFTNQQGFCALGSVKANIGHTLAAAGVSGLLKAVLALKHQQLPPVASYQQQNEHISLDNTPFYVNTRLRDWQPKAANGDAIPRRATVSSFAFSGTNAHVVLQEAPLRKTPSPNQSSPQLIVLSARTGEQLQQQQQALQHWLAANPNANLLALSVSLAKGRKHFVQRAAFVASSVAQLQQQLAGAGDTHLCFTGNTRDKDAKAQFNTQYQAQLEQGLGALLATSLKDSSARTATLTSLAQGYCLGVCKVSDDWFADNVFAKPALVRLSLPVYPFAQESYWLEDADSSSEIEQSAQKDTTVPLATTSLTATNRAADKALSSEKNFSAKPLCFTLQLQQQCYWSGAMVIASVQSLLASKQMQASVNGISSGWSLQNLNFEGLQLRDLSWSDGDAQQSGQDIAPVSKLHLLPFSARFLPDASQQTHKANVEFTAVHGNLSSGAVLKAVTSPALGKVDIRQFDMDRTGVDQTLSEQACYQRLAKIGAEYPAQSRSIKQLKISSDSLLVNIRVPHELVGQQEAELACCFEAVLQASQLMASQPTQTAEAQFYNLKGLGELAIYAPLETVMWAKISRSEAETTMDASGESLPFDELLVDVLLWDANGNIRGKISQLAFSPFPLETHSPVGPNASTTETPLDWMLLRETQELAPHSDVNWQQTIAALAAQSVLVVYSNEQQKSQLIAIAQPLLAHATGSHTSENNATPLARWQFVSTEQIEKHSFEQIVQPEIVLMLGADRTGVDNQTDQTLTQYQASDIRPVFQVVKTLLRQFWNSNIRCYYLFETSLQQSAVDLQALSGLLSTASLENARHVWKLLSVTHDSDAQINTQQNKLNNALQKCMQELLADSVAHQNQSFFQQICFNDNQRYAVLLIEQDEATQPAFTTNTRVFKPQGTYLLVGGLGPIGELVAQYLASQYQANLVILSRGELSAAKQAQMQALQSAGARCSYYQADVTNETATEAAMTQILQNHTLNGVILLANQVQDEILVNKQWHDFHHNIQTKIQSCTLIDKFTANQPLDCFLMFSSIAAFGIPGSSDYAYGSAFQNAFARYRNRLVEQGERSGVSSSLCWGPWTVDYYLRQSDSTSSGSDSEPDRLAKFKRQGTDLITPQGAPQVFDNLALCQQGVLGAVAVANRDIFRQIMGLVPMTQAVAEALSQPAALPENESELSPFEQQLQGWEQALAAGDALSLSAVKASISMDEIKQLPPALIHRLHAVLNACKENAEAGLSKDSTKAATQESIQAPIQAPSEDTHTTDVAQVVADVVANVLELPSIDNEEAFQNYGMDSIVAMQLVSRLEKQLNMDIQPSWLVDYPTVNSFADYLASQKVPTGKVSAGTES